MKAFPHLRIVGKKIETPPRIAQNPINFYEEIIAIDPPERDSFKLLDQELNEKLSLRKSRQLSAKNQLKSDNLEKLLRITSSGITGRNKSVNQKEQTARKYVDRTTTVILKQNSNGVYGIGTRISQNRECDAEKLSYSATSRPPLLNVKFLLRKPESTLDESSKVKSASKLPLYSDLKSIDLSKSELSSKSASLHAKNINIIQLPPFNSFRGIEGRSIQSAFYGKTNLKH